MYFITTATAKATTNPLDFAPFPSNFEIAFVKPVFTATAYSSFYSFYTMNVHIRPGQLVTKNLYLLSASLVNTWGWSSGLRSFIHSSQAIKDGIIIGKNSFVISDVNVDQGALFYSNGTRKYNAVVLGFTEYVTQKEFDSYKRFVMTGGRLILLDACNFLAQVAYYSTSNKLSLVLGHGWAFNGTAAWPSVFDRWQKESDAWLGSHYALYVGSEGYSVQGAVANSGNPIGMVLMHKFASTMLFKSYRGHEENILSNKNDSIIAKWRLANLPSSDSSYTVAAYELFDGPKGGVLIHTGIFGSDLINSDAQFQFFLREAIFPNALT